MADQFFVYDASITAPLSRVPIWPYTLYYRMPHKCHGNAQNCPSRSHPVWEMVINELDRRDGPTFDEALPDWVGPGWAVLGISVALVGHAVVEGVGPDRDPGEGGGDGGIVDEELVSHHLKLFVTTNSEVGSTHTNNRAVSDVGKPLDDETGSSHLSQPVVIAPVSPVVGLVLVSHGEHGHLVPTSVQLLHSRVVGILVTHEERSLDLAAIRILSFSVEDILVEVHVVGVDGSVEGDGDHLGDLVGVDPPWDPGAIRRTETVRELTLGQVAVRSSVRILVNTAGILVRTIRAVRLFITEQLLSNALPIPTL